MERLTGKFSWFWFLAVTCMLFSACSDDDEKNDKEEKLIEGKWILTGLSTNNEQVNAYLPALLEQYGMNLTLITFTFNGNGYAAITLPVPGEELLVLMPAYAYKNKELAFRFDELPVPFNAFYVPELTETKMELTTVFHPLLLTALIRLIEAEDDELAKQLQGLLSGSMEDGLQLDLRLQHVIQ
ncbi:MAG: hypothetical protein LUD02_08525 [Tannerellaceae bacterium]|nr:hypothetical protein [Tannerellaceae bacterium]